MFPSFLFFRRSPRAAVAEAGTVQPPRQRRAVGGRGRGWFSRRAVARQRGRLRLRGECGLQQRLGLHHQRHDRGVDGSRGQSVRGGDRSRIRHRPPLRQVRLRGEFRLHIVSGSVSAYAIDAGTGALSEITGSPFAAGTLTVSVAVDPSGKFAYVVNLLPGGVSAYAIDAATGALSRVGAPVAAGFNPNAIAVDPSGRFAYVANFEGDFVSNVFAYTIDAGTGALSEVAGSPYAAGSDPHAVTVDPSGRFVYVASGQSANVSAYAIDAATGALSAISGSPFAGDIQLAVDPTGKFAYVAGGANGILAYTIDSTTGTLTGSGAFAAGDSPYRVTVDPSGQFAYAVNRGGNDISAYSINATSGALTSIGATVAAGIRPQVHHHHPQDPVIPPAVQTVSANIRPASADFFCLAYAAPEHFFAPTPLTPM